MAGPTAARALIAIARVECNHEFLKSHRRLERRQAVPKNPAIVTSVFPLDLKAWPRFERVGGYDAGRFCLEKKGQMRGRFANSF